MNEKKPRVKALWPLRDWVVFEREIRTIIEQEFVDDAGELIKPAGVFPTRKVLARMGRRDLGHAVVAYHGGFRRVMHRLGLGPAVRPHGYWKDFENVRLHLQPIIDREIRSDDGSVLKRSGEMPTGDMLEAVGEASLLVGIEKYHRGLGAVGSTLGCHRRFRLPGHWKHLPAVQRALREITEKDYRDEQGRLVKPAGEFPTAAVLKKLGFSGLLESISQSHGGLIAVRASMGVAPIQRQKGYWRDFSNVERELRQAIAGELRDEGGSVIKRAGEMPTPKQLVSMGMSSLLAGMASHQGGYHEVRRRLHLPSHRVPPGYWSDPEHLLSELRVIVDNEYRDDDGTIIKARGEFPRQRVLRRIGETRLVGAVSRAGGKREVARMLGFSPSPGSVQRWKDFTTLERELTRVMREEYRDERGKLIRGAGVFPGATELKVRGLGGLVSALWEYHGGSAAVRARMGIPASGGQREYWADFGNVERELTTVIEAESADEFGNVIKPAGQFPTYGDLRRIGRHDILHAMQAFHGGYLRVRDRMGYSAAVPQAVVEEFAAKIKTVEGAEELIRCPDLGIADKADILVARHREVFSSTEYVDWVLRSLLDMPSFAPYVEAGREIRGAYRTGWGLDVLVERHPGLFESRDLFALLVRKMENVFFRQLQAEPGAAMERLAAGIRGGGILGEAYAAVERSLKEIHSLIIPGVVSRIRNPHWFPGSDLPETIPFPSLHQKRGVLRIVELRRALIADEMGTGKTAQAILAARLLQARSGRRIRTLVVCPNSVMAWWRDKIHEYCEGIGPEEVVMVSGRGNLAHAMQRVAEGIDFALINYHLLAMRRGAAYPALVGELAGMGFDLVVADEVHNAKNMNANRAEALQRIAERVPYVALLSGTPIPNRLRDIGMTMALLEPAAYPTARHFTKAYGNNPRLIRDALINGRMLRVRSEDVFELPRLTMREVTVALVPAQRNAYIAIYRDGSIDAYTKMWLLRLLLVDPNAVIRESKGESLPSPKYDALDRLVEETVADGRKVVVFTSIKRGVTRELVRRYERFGVCLIDGDVDAFPRKKKESQRETIRREFQFGAAGILIATLGTMSEGVDLSAASTVVFLDKPFTSTARDQAIKRVHRLGQTKPVEVISIVARDPAIDAVIRDKDTGDHGTIDEAIERLIAKKELLIQHVVDGARLSPEERQLLEERENLGRVLYSLA